MVKLLSLLLSAPVILSIMEFKVSWDFLIY